MSQVHIFYDNTCSLPPLECRAISIARPELAIPPAHERKIDLSVSVRARGLISYRRSRMLLLLRRAIVEMRPPTSTRNVNTSCEQLKVLPRDVAIGHIAPDLERQPATNAFAISPRAMFELKQAPTGTH